MYYALTGESKIYGWPSLVEDKKRGRKHYAIYPIYVNDGTIEKIVGIGEIEKIPEVVTVIQSKGVGTTVKRTGNFSQNFGMIHFVFDTKEEFIEIVNKVNAVLEIKDTNNKNMLITSDEKFFDTVVI